jgi:hypothetical protein
MQGRSRPRHFIIVLLALSCLLAQSSLAMAQPKDDETGMLTISAYWSPDVTVPTLVDYSGGPVFVEVRTPVYASFTLSPDPPDGTSYPLTTTDGIGHALVPVGDLTLTLHSASGFVTSQVWTWYVEIDADQENFVTILLPGEPRYLLWWVVHRLFPLCVFSDHGC